MLESVEVQFGDRLDEESLKILQKIFLCGKISHWLEKTFRTPLILSFRLLWSHYRGLDHTSTDYISVSEKYEYKANSY